MPDGKPPPYRIVDRAGPAAGGDRAEVIAGLLATPATISPKYFYDARGSALFEEITRLPEYYPTRTELALFAEHRAEIAASVGRIAQFVDLGAGDCCKGEAWLAFLAPARYVAVDLAAPELDRALSRMAPDFAEVEMVGVVSDFSRGLALDGVLDERAALFFYPGSSIGNFTPEESVAFLATVRAHCVGRAGSGLLIGVDGKKDKGRLDAAYDDALGVTAAFNRNVLLHLNRRFGFDFPLDGFVHRGFYDPRRGRVEMHLEALRPCTVRLGEATRSFRAGERIHTENSYKYTPEEFEDVLRGAGFERLRRWSSPDRGYHVFHAA